MVINFETEYLHIIVGDEVVTINILAAIKHNTNGIRDMIEEIDDKVYPWVIKQQNLVKDE